MKPNDLKEIRERIVAGMNISAQKFLEKKKLQNGKLIISRNGIIQIIEAKDIK